MLFGPRSTEMNRIEMFPIVLIFSWGRKIINEQINKVIFKR